MKIARDQILRFLRAFLGGMLPYLHQQIVGLDDFKAMMGIQITKQREKGPIPPRLPKFRKKSSSRCIDVTGVLSFIQFLYRGIQPKCGLDISDRVMYTDKIRIHML